MDIQRKASNNLSVEKQGRQASEIPASQPKQQFSCSETNLKVDKPKEKFPLWAILLIIILAAVVAGLLWYYLTIGRFIWDKVSNLTQPEKTEEKGSLQDKTITIESPEEGEIITNPVKIAGSGIAFENTIQLRIKDANGKVLALTSVATNASDMGKRGNFNYVLAYETSGTGEGYVEAFEQSAADGSELNLYSVKVKFGDYGQTAKKQQENFFYMTSDYKDLAYYNNPTKGISNIGTLFSVSNQGRVFANDDKAVFSMSSDNRSKVALKEINIITKEVKTLFEKDKGSYEGIDITSLKASPNHQKLAVILGYYTSKADWDAPSVFDLSIYDYSNGRLESIYTRDARSVYDTIQITDWCNNDEIFMYNFVGDTLGGYYGSTLRLKLSDRTVEDLSEKYKIYGASHASPDGLKVAFNVPYGEAEGVSWGVKILNISNGEAKTVYEKEGPSITVGEANWITSPVWLSDNDTIIFSENSSSGNEPSKIYSFSYSNQNVKNTFEASLSGWISDLHYASDTLIYGNFQEKSSGKSSIMKINLENKTAEKPFENNESVEFIGITN